MPGYLKSGRTFVSAKKRASRRSLFYGWVVVPPLTLVELSEALAHLYVSLSGVAAPHRRRDQQPGELPPRANHLRRKIHCVDAHGRERQRDHLPLLPDLRLHGYTWRAKAFPVTVPSPSATSQIRVFPRPQSLFGKSPATPGSSSRPAHRHNVHRSGAETLGAAIRGVAPLGRLLRFGNLIGSCVQSSKQVPPV